jgi:hypothetical protein
MSVRLIPRGLAKLERTAYFPGTKQGRDMGKPQRKRPKIETMGPTAEQAGRNEYELGDVVDKRPGGGSITVGKAFRRKPMIEILGAQSVFSDAELKALRHYRHHADIADRSPTRDSLDRQRLGGSGTGPTIEMINAIRVRDDCERAAGSLLDILRAVVIDDVSLSQWAIAKHGALEKRRVRGQGKPVTTFEPKLGTVRVARLEIQMAAKRVEAELAA